MDGFFKKEQLVNSPDCIHCGLFRQCKSPRMEATGEGKLGILFIAEAPGKTEDEEGTQLVGNAGQKLRSILAEYNIDLDRDCRKINSINCRPPKNETPSDRQIDYCRPMVLNEIKSFKPKIIVLLGKSAVTSIIGNYWKKNIGALEKWQGWTIPDRNYNSWAIPTYHPSYLLRLENSKNQSDTIFEKQFRDHIQNAIAYSRRKLPHQIKGFEDEQRRVLVLTDKEAIRERIIHANWTWYSCSIDFETTGFRPYDNDRHEIYTAAISNGRETIAFPLYNDNEIKKQLGFLLQNERIGKIAHNKKFETLWANYFLKTQTNNWIWDGMIGAHVLDNREGITSLKFQTYVNFGVADYDSHIEKFLNSSDSNGINKVKNIPLNQLLLYNGLDALFEWNLSLLQMKTMGRTDLIKEYMQNDA